MKHIVITLVAILLTLPSQVMATDFTDTDQLYGWGSSQFWQTWADHKTQLGLLFYTETELDAALALKQDVSAVKIVDAGSGLTLDTTPAGTDLDPYLLNVDIDASGFDGNLATTDDTPQEIAQKVDDLVLGGGAVPTIQAADPDTDDTTGWYLATISGDAFYVNNGVGMFTIPGTYVAASDTTAPTVSTVTINGTAVVVTFDEAVDQGVAWANSTIDLDMSTTGNDIAVTYTSGDGTDTHNFTAASAAVNGETVDLDFSGLANALEDAAGNDLAAIVSQGVTNNTASGSTTIYSAGFEATTFAADAELGGVDGWVETPASNFLFKIDSTSANTGSQSLFVDYLDATKPYIYRTFTAQTSTFVLDVEVKPDDTPASGGRIILANGDATDVANGAVYMGLNGSDLELYNGTTWATVSTSLPTTSYSKIEVEVNPSAETVAIWVNETSKGTFNFSASHGSIDRIAFRTGETSDTTFNIDDLSLYTGAR